LLAASAAAADEGAYLTLLSMGRAAQTDRGPDAGPLGAASAKAAAPGVTRARDADRALAPAAGPGGADEASAAAAPAAVRAEGAPGAESGASVPPDSVELARLRRWARLYSRLAPSRRRAAALAAAAAERASPSAADAAAREGARRGLLELLSLPGFAAAP
jgi:hypothetical protein